MRALLNRNSGSIGNISGTTFQSPPSPVKTRSANCSRGRSVHFYMFGVIISILNFSISAKYCLAQAKLTRGRIWGLTGLMGGA